MAYDTHFTVTILACVPTGDNWILLLRLGGLMQFPCDSKNTQRINDILATDACLRTITNAPFHCHFDVWSPSMCHKSLNCDDSASLFFLRGSYVPDQGTSCRSLYTDYKLKMKWSDYGFYKNIDYEYFLQIYGFIPYFDTWRGLEYILKWKKLQVCCISVNFKESIFNIYVYILLLTIFPNF